MINLGAIEDAYQSIVYGYTEPDEVRMNRATVIKFRQAFQCQSDDPDLPLRYNNATYIEDSTLPDDVIVFVNNKVKDNPPVHLGNIEEKHWKQTVTITDAQPFCRL
jgi:hypothetical protein